MRPDRDLVLFGRSIGAAVAVETAARTQVCGVAFESLLTSVRDSARRTYPLLPGGLLTRMFEARCDALARIGEVRSPLLCLRGDRD